MANIKKYFPHIYNGILEIDVLSDIQNKQFTDFEKEINNFVMNQFVATCSIEKLEELERTLKILIKNESLEFRREIILNRLSMSGPYTLSFLKRKLDTLIGINKYEVYVDYDNYTLYVESSSLNQSWFQEVYITINNIKPANIVFKNKPRSNSDILINEHVEYQKKVYNYRLGLWELNGSTFSKLGGNEVIKSPSSKSINKNLIDDLKQSTLNSIEYININNKTIINNFIFKGLNNDELIIEYSIDETMGISAINKVNLCDINNRVLTSIDLYVPVIGGLNMKHVIKLEEGIING